jgi:hypothetical protein
MNIIINLSDILDQNDKLLSNRIQFLNSKRNITMDGEFTKIVFITEHFSTDSIFMEFPVQIYYDSRYIASENFKKNGYIKLNSINQPIVNKCIELEKQLLTYYKQYKNIIKNPIFLLHNHLLNGNLKFFKSHKNNSIDPMLEKNKTYSIKISGIWESYDSIGITYKIIEFDG